MSFFQAARINFAKFDTEPTPWAQRVLDTNDESLREKL
jgi:hypothetical protein